MPGGRPTKYKNRYCQALDEHMKEGFSYSSFAGLIGVHLDTLYAWERKHPEFSEAKKRGELKSLLHWEKLGMNGISGEIKGFNAATYIFNMKNRFGWADRNEASQEHETTIKIAYDPLR